MLEIAFDRWQTVVFSDLNIMTYIENVLVSSEPT